VRSGTHGRHEVALTLDDGFSIATIGRISEILIREKVPATFFVIGRVAARDASVIRPLAEAGFPFGSHTYSHGVLTRPWLSVEAIAKDMLAGSAAIERATGVRTVPFVRAPGGYTDDKVLQAAKAAGFRAVVKWAVDSGDAVVSDPGVITWRAERGWNGSIILMHMNRATSADILPAIIASYRARGYRFVTLGQMFGVPGPVPTFGPAPSATPSPTPKPSPSPAPSATPVMTPVTTGRGK
jgi:peptidoglycan/xylan/chitin deacetylase (PgdA/CDA1 family)